MTLTIAAIAVAFIVVTVEPRRRRRVVFTSREIMTLIRLVGSVADRATPGADVGNETVTVSLADPPNPLFLAYTHGVFASVVVQMNELPGVAVNWAAPEPFVPSKMLMIPAVAAA